MAEHDAIRGEKLRLEDLQAEAAERAGERCSSRVGRAADAARAMPSVAADHPYREASDRHRMQSLARTGRHVEALADV